MKRNLIYAFVIIIISIGYFIINQSSLEHKEELSLKRAVKAAIGTREDPNARFRYEYMRLRNPETGKIPEDIREKELAFASNLPIRGLKEILPKTGRSEETAIVSTNWQLRGPYNVGGRTRALAIDVSNENIILAGGVSGGMWRSTDGGASWIKTTGPDQLHSVTCLAQDTRLGHTNTWYYGTGEYRGNSASGDGDNSFFLGDGVFKSVDGGLSWTKLTGLADNSPQDFSHVSEIVWNVKVDPSNSAQEEVYAAVYGVIYRSTNAGENWSAVVSPTPGSGSYSRYTDIDITSTGVVYATFSSENATTKGIWRSTNGTDWTNITPVTWPSDYRRIVLSIAPSNENVVYFLAQTPEGDNEEHHDLWKYEYISGDGTGSGGTWSDRSANLPAEGGTTGDFQSQTSYDLLIKVKPNDENTVFIGGINLYRSTDGFSTAGNEAWIGGYVSTNDSYSSYENHHADQHALVFYSSNNNKAISGHDGGLSITDHISAYTVEWQLLNNGYQTTQFYTCGIDYAGTGDNLIVGGMQDNGTYKVDASSSTAPWTSMLSGDGAYCAVGEGTVAKNIYASAQNGLIYRMSAFNPNDWARVDPDGATGYIFINPFILDRNNSKMMYVAGGSVLWRSADVTTIPKSNDPASSDYWTELTNSAVVSGTISTLEVSTTPANRLYYATDQGEVYRIDGANSGNPTPVNITSGDFPSGYISSVSVNPDNADEAVVAFSNYEIISLWHTSNAGTSWQNISGNLEQESDGKGNGPSVRWAEILPTDNGTIYLAGTSTGLYSTFTLNGASTVWALEGATSIGNVVVDMIDSRTTDDLAVVATHGNGMYSSNVAVSIKENPKNIVTNFKLGQNYPNPFNPNTTIEYQVPESAPVTLKVYNIQGKEIATLVNSDHIPGNYSVNWNGQDRFGRPVTSGTYIYQIKAGKHRESKQMVLMR